MDHDSDEQARDSATRTSAKHISNSRESCAEGAEHVRQSREAIGRSLDLLRETGVTPE